VIRADELAPLYPAQAHPSVRAQIARHHDLSFSEKEHQLDIEQARGDRPIGNLTGNSSRKPMPRENVPVVRFERALAREERLAHLKGRFPGVMVGLAHYIRARPTYLPILLRHD
jgi:hypothetical protein